MALKAYKAVALAGLAVLGAAGLSTSSGGRSENYRPQQTEVNFYTQSTPDLLSPPGMPRRVLEYTCCAIDIPDRVYGGSGDNVEVIGFGSFIGSPSLKKTYELDESAPGMVFRGNRKDITWFINPAARHNLEYIREEAGKQGITLPETLYDMTPAMVERSGRETVIDGNNFQSFMTPEHFDALARKQAGVLLNYLDATRFPGTIEEKNKRLLPFLSYNGQND